MMNLNKFLYILLMGVYLSEPNKDKHFVEGAINGMSFVSAEMQGKAESI